MLTEPMPCWVTARSRSLSLLIRRRSTRQLVESVLGGLVPRLGRFGVVRPVDGCSIGNPQIQYRICVTAIRGEFGPIDHCVPDIVPISLDKHGCQAVFDGIDNCRVLAVVDGRLFGSQNFFKDACGPFECLDFIPSSRLQGDMTNHADGDTSLAALAHASSLFAPFMGPLLIWIIADDDDTLVEENAKSSLNFEIVFFIAILISFVLTFVLIGFLFLLVLIPGGVVVRIVGMLRASEGEIYYYPFTPNLI